MQRVETRLARRTWRCLYGLGRVLPNSLSRALHPRRVRADTRYENSILGYKPKMMSRAGRIIQEKDKDALGSSFDVVSFGHLIFEIALGYELTAATPEVEQLVGRCEYGLIELMVFIFFHPDNRIPSLEEVSACVCAWRCVRAGASGQRGQRSVGAAAEAVRMCACARVRA